MTSGALDRAIALLTDGHTVDWDALAAAAATEAERDALRELQHLSLDLGPSPGAPDPPAAWAHLRILEELGRGASGVVFRAWDTRLEREVALKLLPGDSGDTTFQEAKRLARITHPSIVAIYGVDQRDGCLGLWMELLQGETLDRTLRTLGPMSAREAAGVVRELCGAVAAVHAAGLVHRDIKAQNVIREPGGRIVLMDLGASETLAIDDARVGSLAGTPLYMAPELFTGGRATIASDIYAIGVLLYRLVTGTYPVEGATIGDVRQAHAERTLRPLREARPDLPGAFVAIVERCLSPRAEDRFRSASELERTLNQWDSGTSAGPFASRSAILSGLLLASLFGGAATWLWLRVGAPGAIEQPAGLSPEHYALVAGYDDLAFERLADDPLGAASAIRSAIDIVRPAIAGLSPGSVLLYLRVAEAERGAGRLDAARAAILDAQAHAVSVLDESDPLRIVLAAEEARLAAAARDSSSLARASQTASRLRKATFGVPDTDGPDLFPSLTIPAHRQHDPARLGWQIHVRFPASGTPVAEGPAAAWRLEARESMAYYFQRLPRGLTRRAMARGFSVFARVAPENGLANVAFDATPSGARFDLFWQRTTSGQIELRTASSIVPRDGPTAIIETTSDRDAPLVELRFDPGAHAAAVFVDGAKLLDGYRGHAQYQEANAGVFSWGVARDDASGGARPAGRFHLVWLEVR